MHADSQSRRPAAATEHVDLAVEVFRMLSDATRVQVLWALLDGERSVNELADAVGKPASGVSQHLAKLRLARLVTTRRQANQIFYRIDSAHVRQLVEDAIYHAEHAAGGIPQHHWIDSGLRRFPGPDPGHASDSPRQSLNEKAR